MKHEALDTDIVIGAAHQSVTHDSAAKHVTGQADYTDDLVEPAGTLHAALGLSTIAHGRVRSMNLDKVRAAPGVVAVLTAADIAGANDISPTGNHDDPIFVADEVMFHGQPLFAVIAESRLQARHAAARAEIGYEALPHHLAPLAARDAGMDYVTEPLRLRRGEPETAMAQAPRRCAGRFEIGGQDHFYLEGQIALAIPGEDDEMTIFVSTQHPSEVQHMVAHALGVRANAVVVNVRRMGGGFGGKETQMNLFACVAAIAARRLGRAVKLRPDRDEDMIATGKRHDFVVDYEVGFDEAGRILAVTGDWHARCGFSADLSGPVTDRALFHADNAYFYPDVELRSHPWRTHTVSNTAFRGFGGPQGVIVAERIIEEIAYATGQDTLAVRKANLYRDGQLTPYHQPVEDQILPRLFEELEASADYARRRSEVLAFNAKGGVIRRGIALTPVKFGISFTATFLNQAGALIHIYTDGSIHLNHGGTEMGQGLNTKVAQVVAEVFQVDIDRVQITATNTDKVPNTSPTAASSGADLNGKAAQNAAETLKQRLVEFAAKHWKVTEEDIEFRNNQVRVRDLIVPFEELVQQAYFGQVSLSSTGFYRTPKIYYDRSQARGRPFYYYAYGVSCSEVIVDTLTGEYKMLRSDILHDVGASLNPAIDIGQVEGGFVQGMGWLTMEELVWNAKGKLMTNGPASYKIPAIADMPIDLRVKLVENRKNPEQTVFHSKAVGEPPFMLGISVFCAIKDAVASLADYRAQPQIDAPAT
ncbi:MAG: xanthine dehydrogenase molybdopterin binding subunit, partial [Ancylobacter novellus]